MRNAPKALPPLSAFLAGETFGGKYVQERQIGSGGMGIVVLARHVLLDELVAIKILLPQLVDQTEIVERFLREARAAAKIKSEHVVRVTDVARTDAGTPYMVMEYMEGEDLAKVLAHGAPLSPRQATEYVLQVCEGLAEAHALGIFHRDLKPGNLFLTKRRNGTPLVKVLDFGISKYTPEEMTLSSDAFGTPSYMSPEQIESAKHVDGRTDIWALGCVLYKLLTGVTPFRSEGDVHVTHFILTTPALPPSLLRPEIPVGLDNAIMGCLEKHVEKRFSSIPDLMAALESALSEMPVDTVQPLSEVVRRPSPGSVREANTIAGLAPAPRARRDRSVCTLPPGTPAILSRPESEEPASSGNTTPLSTPEAVLEAAPLSETVPMPFSEQLPPPAADPEASSSKRDSVTTTFISTRPPARSSPRLALILPLFLLLGVAVAILWSVLVAPRGIEPTPIPLPSSDLPKLNSPEETP